MSGGVEVGIKEVLRKAYERLIPAIGYLVSPQAGFAASVAVFTTWLLTKIKGAKTLGEAIEDEESILIDLSVRIDEQKAKVAKLKEELSKVSDETTREVMSKVLESEEQVLEKLKEEYELHQLRILALRKVRELSGDEVFKRLWKLLKKIEKGKEFEEEQLRLMEELSERWRSRQLKLSILRQVIEYG